MKPARAPNGSVNIAASAQPSPAAPSARPSVGTSGVRDSSRPPRQRRAIKMGSAIPRLTSERGWQRSEAPNADAALARSRGRPEPSASSSQVSPMSSADDESCCGHTPQ